MPRALLRTQDCPHLSFTCLAGSCPQITFPLPALPYQMWKLTYPQLPPLSWGSLPPSNTQEYSLGLGGQVWETSTQVRKQGSESVCDVSWLVSGNWTLETALFGSWFLLNVCEEKIQKCILHLINNASDRGGLENYCLLSGFVFVYNFLKSLNYFRTQI